MKTDLSVLFKKPDKDKEVILTIEPLAPLSIVSTLPGSYYKSLDKPTKMNLCGMFENILGWHIGPKDRNAIVKQLKKHYKKEFGIKEFKPESSRVGYTPLIGHLFEIGLPIVPPVTTRYDDIWKQQLYRDGYPHPNGTPNISYELIPAKRSLNQKENGVVTNDAIAEFHKKNKGEFPKYYTSPRKREFIIWDGDYKCTMKINGYLLEILSEKTNKNNLSYIGSNEGWVNVKIEIL
jgi:CRISPR-associated protein Cas5